ncbi:uncharacterized protein Z519_11280 [Cladophialophora bantiana CBS 173.52]|uniref:N-acetyltransferase domain-containing protein n=1 Tax=Cladophialophora bantiana (strain ATCC 10958 / CBS 173.52 / CDC B-1940 / NIH 8579) TaxID=1442370 RepID=A0A0D2HUE5_CLAB1|nr:uncharacterized protein Z519_11280 [Cladophialophora bantiana CBS 173.52]KIW88169.1 hypothetical protein Z519_11280 [Cladophialophora bantiana CBS 173.52]
MAEDQIGETPAAPEREATPIFRPAEPHEDDMLSRILCNAFLPLWNHNWFHGVSRPLEPVMIGTPTSKPHMNSLQKSRVRFYRSLISMTRLLDGLVLVAEVNPPAVESDANNATTTKQPDIGAVLLWLPPKKRMGTFDLLKLWRSGFLGLMLPWHYGLTGFYRIQLVFEENIHKMWTRTLPDLPPHGFKEDECGFVQMIASNPKYAGKRYASALLNYKIEQHFAEFPDRPVILDTTTTQGIRAYEKLGFKLLAEVPVDSGTDAQGMKLKSNASGEIKTEARETCIQRVMARLP